MRRARRVDTVDVRDRVDENLERRLFAGRNGGREVLQHQLDDVIAVDRFRRAPGVVEEHLHQLHRRVGHPRVGRGGELSVRGDR